MAKQKRALIGSPGLNYTSNRMAMPAQENVQVNAPLASMPPEGALKDTRDEKILEAEAAGDMSHYNTFGEAFGRARALGLQTFTWSKGKYKKYGTNLASQTSNTSQAISEGLGEAREEAATTLGRQGPVNNATEEELNRMRPETRRSLPNPGNIVDYFPEQQAERDKRNEEEYRKKNSVYGRFRRSLMSAPTRNIFPY